MNLLKTTWQNLVMVNYEVEKKFLERYVPDGCEIDLYQGRALVSVVTFEFCNTRICGIPIPFYKKFPEINLRFYVRRKVAGAWRRGVVFIKEVIPHRFPAMIARLIFKENFHVMPVSLMMAENELKYEWGVGNLIEGVINREELDWPEGTEEQFIGDRFWAFKRVDEEKTIEFKISHRAWKMRVFDELEVRIDFETLYGAALADEIEAHGGEPSSVFYVDGSAVGVTIPQDIHKA